MWFQRAKIEEKNRNRKYELLRHSDGSIGKYVPSAHDTVALPIYPLKTEELRDQDKVSWKILNIIVHFYAKK